MNNGKTSLLLACIFMLAAAVPAMAQKKAPEKMQSKAQEKKQEMSQGMTQAQEEKNADAAATEVETAARGEGGEKVKAKIMTRFRVDEGRIRTMREEGGMNYGEISLALSLAKGMEGGINDDNIARITAMRQGEPKMGWGKIAKDLGQKLGPAISQTRKMSAELRKEARKRGGKDGKKSKEMKKKKEMKRDREMKEHRERREHTQPMGGAKGGGGKGGR